MQTRLPLKRDVPTVPAPVVEFEEWEDFLPALEWNQGEHVTIAAPTGWGKTTLGLAILPAREYVIVLGTKPRDATLEPLKADGYKVIREWPPPPLADRLIFWPRIDSVTDLPKQKEAFRKMLLDVYRSGGWTLYVDELDYVCNYLRLSPLVELLWRQGRSLGLTIVGGTQRPAFIPLLAYDQASHLFVGRDNDEVNLRRYASIAGGGKSYQKQVRSAITGLRKHHFLYLHGRREGFIETKVS